MRTEDQYYEEHLVDLINTLASKIDYLENKGSLDDQDEMELDALDRLLRDVESL